MKKKIYDSIEFAELKLAYRIEYLRVKIYRGLQLTSKCIRKINGRRTSVVAQQDKLLPAVPAAHIGALVQVLIAPCLTQFHANTSGKEPGDAGDGPSALSPATHGSLGWSSGLLAAGWIIPGHCSRLDSDPEDERPLSLPLCL